jgi:DNA gyrase subunit A
LPLENGERINAILPIREFDEKQFVFMATANGTVKKTPLSGFSRPRANGIIAIDLRENDYLIDVAITDGSQDIMLFSDAGKVIRFTEADVRQMGRTACGVRGIKLPKGNRVISLIIASDSPVLTATENGYGKRTMAADYPVYGRGGQGVIAIQVTERNGAVVGAVPADDNDEVMLISSGGTLVRTRVNEISVMGRNTQGVNLISLSKEEVLVGIERILEEQDEDQGEVEQGEAE